jgi:hypothetical protein
MKGGADMSSLWHKHGPTKLGQAGAITKGIFLTGEPLVEHAEYMLRQNGLDKEMRAKYYSRFARTETTDRIYRKLLETSDPEIQSILAKGFLKSFNRALDNHDSEVTSQYSASAMLGHFREKKEYVLKVLGQADELLRRSFLVSDAVCEVFSGIKERVEIMKTERWMEDDPRGC